MSQSTKEPIRYPEVSVKGEPREMGRQLGEAARERIRKFCATALSAVQRTATVSQQEADRITQQSLDATEKYAPELVDELRGVAEGAGVTLSDVFFLQIRNQFAAGDRGCTSISFSEVTGLGPIVAQNWDNDPDLDPWTIVLSRHPDNRPATINLTQAGLIAYIGCNDRGLGACLNTLPAPQRASGVPHYFTLRKLFECDSIDAAVSAINAAHRAIPANIMLATPDGPADLEVTIDGVHLLQDQAAGHLCHTNHCVHQKLESINADFPELIQSHGRLHRIKELISKLPASIELRDIQSLLRDHDNHPRSICRHHNDDETTGF